MRRARFFCSALVVAVAQGGCASSAPSPPAMTPAQAPARDGVAELSTIEADMIEKLAVADPRFAARARVAPSPAVLHKIVTAAILDEDESTLVRDGSLDLFSVRARAGVLAKLDAELGGFQATLPESSDRALDRPRLERELLARLLGEERARAEIELRLADDASDLIRGVVAMWSAPRSALDARDRDGWLARRLSEVAGSLRHPPPRQVPSDLDASLLLLEPLLLPSEFPHSVEALSHVHMAIDADTRPRVATTPRPIVATRAQAFLGVAPSYEALAASEASLRADAEAALSLLSPSDRASATAAAREMLFGEAICPPPAKTIVRALTPPPARSAVCAVLRAGVALGDPAKRPAALLALHDYAAIASWSGGPPEHGARLDTLSFRAGSSDHERMMEQSHARPLIALGAGLAAAKIYRAPADAPRVAQEWMAFGDAPLDIIEREVK